MRSLIHYRSSGQRPGIVEACFDNPRAIYGLDIELAEAAHGPEAFELSELMIRPFGQWLIYNQLFRLNRLHPSTLPISFIPITEMRTAQILDDALGAIGHTPLIRLDKIAEAHGVKCNLCK